MRPAPRLYLPDDLAEEAQISLGEGQSKYLARVMRLNVGDSVRVFNGRDGEWLCEIAKIEGKQVFLDAKTQSRKQIKSKTDLILLFAPLKKSQTDIVIEKATELGVQSICPVMTERTQTRHVRTDRFEKIAIEAAEQSERLAVPHVFDLRALEDALDGLPDETAIIYCDEAHDENSKATDGLSALNGRAAAILIGPEGGFSPDERKRLHARSNVHTLSLGPRILRAETAAISALTLWQAVCGDW